MTTDSDRTLVITSAPDSDNELTEWHRSGERQFLISVNDFWSVWAITECDHPGQLSYSFNITPLPPPNCEPLIPRSVCNEYYDTIAMPNRFGLTDQISVYYFEFGLQYVAMCHLHLKFFFCMYAYPRCTDEGTNQNNTQPIIDMPCSQFCDEITTACATEFAMNGRYLSMLKPKCALLPDQHQYPDCIYPTVDCGPPQQSTGTSGHWNFNSTSLGSVATFICPTGYDVMGTREIYCEYTGSWTENEASCIPIDDNTGLYAGIACAVTLVVLLVVAIPLVYKWRYEINVLLYNRFRFRFRKLKENEGKKYDAFIAYNVKV